MLFIGKAAGRIRRAMSKFILNALELDSGIPLIFSHQKYMVTIIAKTTAKLSGGIWKPESSEELASLISLPRYCPAQTLLMGPVKI
jgi:hypothetical protein